MEAFSDRGYDLYYCPIIIIVESSILLLLGSLRVNFLNKQGGCEALNRSYGCWKCCLEQEECYDIFIHLFCHACALCQEARELHRRLPDPGFNSQPLLVTIPPGQQTMGRDGAWEEGKMRRKYSGSSYFCVFESEWNETFLSLLVNIASTVARLMQQLIWLRS